MTSGAWALLGLTLVLAGVNWWAVYTDRRRVEYFCKPATMVALIVTALALDPADSAVRMWFIVAMVFSLAGDVFLMLPRDLFIAGLVSFLFGHVAYVIGLVIAHESVPLTGVGLVVVAMACAVVVPRVLAAVSQADRRLVRPVAVYILVISAMVVAAWGTVVAIAIVGALLFYLSDATLAWNRFVHEYPQGRILVMVSYHLGQIGLALGLVSLA